jgi:predicted extracellular nuclease
MNSTTWKIWTRVACLVLLGAVPAAAQVPTELFISEYVEGSSNNKAIEIYNGTAGPIDLAVGGYNVVVYFNGGVTPGTPIDLTGTVAAGEVYVLAHGAANATVRAQADQLTSTTLGWYNGDDAVVLRKGTAIVDVIGQIGLDPGSEWGTGLVSTADNTLRRQSSVCAGDPDGSNAFDPSPEWDGFAADTFDDLGAHATSCTPVNAPVLVSCGSTLAVGQGSSATRTVTASDADGIVITLDLTSVTPTPSAGTISRTAFSAATAVGGTASAIITVDASIGAGNYELLMTAANDDVEPQTGTCTFTVSVVQPIEIWEIQGSGAASPLVGQVVRTENNIVTALAWSGAAFNGFFIQTPDDRADLSAETSNGIFVYTGSAPTVQVGDMVDVTATVAEYFNMTELTGPAVTLDSSGNVLPAATLFTEISPGVFVPSHDQPWPPNELERFEGMRVRVENGRATAPTDQYGDLAIVAGATRAFREPGMKFPGEFSYPLLWDGNPEIFEINPDAAGLPDVALPAGSIIDVAEGPLAFSFSSYQIWPTTFTYTPATMPQTVRARNAGEMTVASQNMLRFFDANPNNGPDDGPVTPEQYQNRLAKASLHIRTVLGAPDVLCLQEIENVGVLQDLAARIASDDASLVYAAHLLEGHDVGGIDTGFLVRNTVSVESVTQVGYSTLLSLDGSYLNDRPPLVLQAQYIANGAPFPITVIGVHGRSLSGIEGSTADANRVRQKRLEQALELANYIQELQAADSTRRIVVTGDFNAFEFSDGYVDVLGIVTGMLDQNGAIQPGHADVVTPNLFNLVNLMPSGERYSFVFEGNAQALDHALMTVSATTFLRDLVFARGNADVPATFRTDTSAPLGTSDHDGLVLYVMTDADGDGVPDDQDVPSGVGSDFTGDLKSDILWHHATLGEVWLWPMDGGQSTAQSYVSTVGDPGWEIRGLGDQTGDGQADLLWRHGPTGQLYLWTMDGSTVEAETYLGTVDPAFDIVGTGDYSGDGKSDILWRHATTGELWLWVMNGAVTQGVSYVDTVDVAYEVQGSGDLNGDGRADLVWQHATAGDVWVWLMNGPVATSVTYVGTVTELAYQIVGVSDYTGDGRADLLWWHATRGEVWLWQMNGAAKAGEAYVATVPDVGYRIVGTGDYDGTGPADILWQHGTGGDVWVWLMNGAVKLSEHLVGTVPDTGYRIIK